MFIFQNVGTLSSISISFTLTNVETHAFLSHRLGSVVAWNSTTVLYTSQHLTREWANLMSFPEESFHPLKTATGGEGLYNGVKDYPGKKKKN